jgi:hypothetical protein
MLLKKVAVEYILEYGQRVSDERERDLLAGDARRLTDGSGNGRYPWWRASHGGGSVGSRSTLYSDDIGEYRFCVRFPALPNNSEMTR